MATSSDAGASTPLYQNSAFAPPPAARRSWLIPAIASGVVALALIIGLSVGLTQRSPSSPTPLMFSAVAKISNGSIIGTITFSQTFPGAPVSINVSVTGLNPAPPALHGFHVHASADLGGNCANAGAHFNPLGAVHGGPSAAVRHVGDLGNVQADASGNLRASIVDSVISLDPANVTYSILNRAIMVHALEDDLGLGCSTGGAGCTSNTTGNAGGRIACAVITPLLSSRDMADQA